MPLSRHSRSPAGSAAPPALAIANRNCRFPGTRWGYPAFSHKRRLRLGGVRNVSRYVSDKSATAPRFHPSPCRRPPPLPAFLLLPPLRIKASSPAPGHTQPKDRIKMGVRSFLDSQVLVDRKVRGRVCVVRGPAGLALVRSGSRSAHVLRSAVSLSRQSSYAVLLTDSAAVHAGSFAQTSSSCFWSAGSCDLGLIV